MSERKNERGRALVFARLQSPNTESLKQAANAFLSRLELIWPMSSLKISKMSKNAFLAKLDLY